MMKRAGIVVDCCGEIRRITRPLKAGFPCRSEGSFKQQTDAELILTQILFGFLYNLNEIRISGLLEFVSCDRVKWA